LTIDETGEFTDVMRKKIRFSNSNSNVLIDRSMLIVPVIVVQIYNSVIVTLVAVSCSTYE